MSRMIYISLLFHVFSLQLKIDFHESQFHLFQKSFWQTLQNMVALKSNFLHFI